MEKNPLFGSTWLTEFMKSEEKRNVIQILRNRFEFITVVC